MYTTYNVKASNNTSIEVSNTDITFSTVQPIDNGAKKATCCRVPCEKSCGIRTEKVNSEAKEVKDNHKVMEDTSSKKENHQEEE